MSTPLSYAIVTDWVNHADPRNIPPSVRIMAAEDILRWENSHKALTQRSNEHDSTIGNLSSAISIQAGQIAALETDNASQATMIQNLTSELAIKSSQITALTRGTVVRGTTDAYQMLASNRIHIHTAGSATYTLPDATTNAGAEMVVYNKGTGTLSVTAMTNQLYFNGNTIVTTTMSQHNVYHFVSDGQQWLMYLTDSATTL